MSRRHKKKPGQQPAAQNTGIKKWLGLVLILAGASLLAIVAYLIMGPTRPDNMVSAQGPRLEVDQTTVDYGQVKYNTPIKSVFTLRNVGDAPLKIEQTPQVELVEGCWPPPAVVSSTTIKPGDSATIALNFTMHAGMDGPHEFRVHVKTNDPMQPETQLTVLSDWVP